MYTEEPLHDDDSIKSVFESQSQFNNSQADLNVNFDKQLNLLNDIVRILKTEIDLLRVRIEALEPTAPTPPSPQS